MLKSKIGHSKTIIGSGLVIYVQQCVSIIALATI